MKCKKKVSYVAGITLGATVEETSVWAQTASTGSTANKMKIFILKPSITFLS